MSERLLAFLQAALVIPASPFFWIWSIIVAVYMARLRDHGTPSKLASQVGCTAWLLGAILIGMIWRYQFPASWFAMTDTVSANS